MAIGPLLSARCPAPVPGTGDPRRAVAAAPGREHDAGVAGLLERDDASAVLDRALADALSGRGRVVLVAGEAGVGKTSLVRSFAEQIDRLGAGTDAELAEHRGDMVVDRPDA